MRITLAELASGLGMLLGTAGFVMGLMNYLRDRPKIKVTLRWDLTEEGTNKNFGIVRVTNVGRRPTYISVAALQLSQRWSLSEGVIAFPRES